MKGYGIAALNLYANTHMKGYGSIALSIAQRRVLFVSTPRRHVLFAST